LLASSLRRTLRLLLLTTVATGLLLPAATAHAEPSLAEIQEQIATESARLTRVVENYNKVREELKAARESAADLEAELEPLLDEMEQAQAGLDELAATAYMTGDMASLSSIFEGGSAGSLIDRLNVLDQVARAHNEELRGHVAVRDRYEREQRELATVQAVQKEKADELAAKRRAIEADLDDLYELREQAYGQAQETADAAATAQARASAPNVAGSAGAAVDFAYGALGTPYAWGGAGSGGYDCSGLTMAAWRAAGVNLPHNAAMQWDATTRIDRSQLAPGDLVFYNGLGHVGIYVGSNQIIHSPTFGQVVHVASVDVMTPYGYGRVRA